VALLALVCAGAVATSCGEDANPRDEIATALREIRADFDAGRIAKVCARMSTGPRCPATVRFLRDRATPNTSSMRAGEREVVGVELRRDRATATVTLGERVPGQLRFVRRDGGWRLADLGVRADLERSRWKSEPDVLRPSPVPATPASCPPITRILNRGEDPVRGGCILRFAGDDVAVVLLTAFGDFAVASCAMSYTVHVAVNTTEAVVDHIEFAGPGLCAETRRCRDGETGLRYPWQGDKLTGSLAAGMHLRFDICVNTPLGRARGMLHYRLFKRGPHLVARAYDFPIGDSSVQLLGAWDVEPDDLAEAARRR
jgi:hypothetical protein